MCTIMHADGSETVLKSVWEEIYPGRIAPFLGWSMAYAQFRRFYGTGTSTYFAKFYDMQEAANVNS